MWVGSVASLPLPPPPMAATAGSSIFSITPLSPPHRRAADKTIATSACAQSFHATIGNGGALNPVPPFFPGGRRTGGRAVAFASPRRRRGTAASPGLVEMDFDGVDYDEWEDEDGKRAEGDGSAMPFDEMRRWLSNKPAGFGEGKSYDTSIEDRLLEEIEQSRKAQLANINKLKSGAAGQERPKQQRTRVSDADVAEVAPIACVRVRGLPRKKNVDKDLRLAFKRFQSIVNISPAVVGNKKTRDPVCKGFAFIDFDSDEAANKFVQTYSKQSILFGRVQKEITCDIVTTFHSHEPGPENLSQNFTRQQLTDFQGEASREPNLSVSAHDLNEKDSGENYQKFMTEDLPFPQLVGTALDIGYSHESFLLSEERPGFGNDMEVVEPGFSKQKQKAEKVSRKKSVKTKPNKAMKLSVPASVRRLKVKERAVLTGVLSKYGEQAVPVFLETK